MQQEPVNHQQSPLTSELVKDLIELLPHDNLEVRHGAISAVLQYTPTRGQRLKFKDTELMHFLRKYIFVPKLAKLCLSTLIHFTVQSEFLHQNIQILEPLVLQMKEWKGLQLELSLLFLLNISKEQEIVMKIVGQEEKRGYLMEILFALLQKVEAVRWIAVGVFVNVAAVQRGRRFLVEENMAVRFSVFLLHPQEKLREGSLKIIRNCAFEWQYEPFVTQIFRAEYGLFPRLIKLILVLLFEQELIPDLNHTKLLLRKNYAQQQLSKLLDVWTIGSKQKALQQIELAIDIMLIFANADLKGKNIQVDSQLFKEILALLNYTDIKPQNKDKLQALEIFGF